MSACALLRNSNLKLIAHRRVYGRGIVMSMKDWTDEELISTRDRLESLGEVSKKSGSGTKMWLFTGLLGAFAISTGVTFMILDGIDVMSIILIIMGTITCISWYKSDKQRKDNLAFLEEINREIKSRKLKVKNTSKTKDKVTEQAEGSEQMSEIEDQNDQTAVTSESANDSKKSEEKSDK